MNTFKIAVNDYGLDAKIPQGDPLWADFNDSFVNHERDVMSFCNDIYGGHAYTSWHNGRRKADNFLLGQVIPLDFDTQDQRSTISTLSKHRLVDDFACIIHTTPSHEVARPKARMIFPLAEPIQTAKGFQVAIRALHTQFPHADKAPTNPASFFYGSKGADIWFNDFNAVPAIPLDALRYLAKKMQQTKPKQTVVSGDYKAPEMQELANALRYIDPYSIDYNRWIGFIATIKRTFGDGGLGLATAWAQGARGEVEREWQRLKTETSSQPMTVKTIFQIARDNGYGTQRNAA